MQHNAVSGFKTKKELDQNDKVPILYFESVQLDGRKTFLPKQLLDLFQQCIKRVYEIDIVPMISGTELKEQN